MKRLRGIHNYRSQIVVYGSHCDHRRLRIAVYRSHSMDRSLKMVAYRSYRSHWGVAKEMLSDANLKLKFLKWQRNSPNQQRWIASNVGVANKPPIKASPQWRVLKLVNDSTAAATSQCAHWLNGSTMDDPINKIGAVWTPNYFIWFHILNWNQTAIWEPAVGCCGVNRSVPVNCLVQANRSVVDERRKTVLISIFSMFFKSLFTGKCV